METDPLLARLAAELERPRALPAQVGRHLNSTYGLGREEVAAFIDEKLEGLEDYEIDLILSPAFTPSLADQALFAPLLGDQALSLEAIDSLVRTLAARPTVASLESDDGTSHRVKLRDVTIERFVRRLRLEGSIPEALCARLRASVPASDQGLALAVARRAVWNSARRPLFERYVERMAAAGEWHAADVKSLLRLVETYEPADPVDFLARLPGWIEAVRREASAAMNPKPFFNERVEDLHGGGRDQRRAGDAKAAEREAELLSLQRLQQLLGT